MEADKSGLTVKITNNQPIDLLSLGLSFAAFSEEFNEFVNASPDETRLCIRELRSGSLIADLVAFSEQMDWLRKHGEFYAAFVTNFSDLVNFFLGKPHNLKENPAPKQAKNMIKIVDPVARDSASQLNINVADGGIFHINININSTDANAIQNAAERYIGPQIPASSIMTDQLMQLEQVKNNARRQGDRGIITEIIDKPVKLIFASERAKNAVLGLQDNPFKCLFLVDLEVIAHEGKPKIYKIYTVKDIVRD